MHIGSTTIPTGKDPYGTWSRSNLRQQRLDLLQRRHGRRRAWSRHRNASHSAGEAHRLRRVHTTRQCRSQPAIECAAGAGGFDHRRRRASLSRRGSSPSLAPFSVTLPSGCGQETSVASHWSARRGGFTIFRARRYLRRIGLAACLSACTTFWMGPRAFFARSSRAVCASRFQGKSSRRTNSFDLVPNTRAYARRG
jgi:hypothetical protein